MSYRIFLAGASGVIGARLVSLLLDAGHRVAGTTRSAAKAALLRTQGVQPLVVDVFDAAALSRAVAAFRPEVVIHQLTDLPRNLEPSQMKDAIIRNARIRREGTRNLVDAALAAGAHRLIAQSIAWAYAPGREPHAESDRLDVAAEGDRAVSVNGVIALEALTLQSSPLQGIVLRYGHLYGPGSHSETAADSPPIHVDAAAYAALLAVDNGEPGAFNIAEQNPHVATDKARLNLGWNAEFRLSTLPEQHRNRL